MANSRYFWGTGNVFPLSVYMSSVALGSLAAAVPLTLTPISEPAIAAGCSFDSVRLSLIATLAYTLLYYNIIGAQVESKVHAGAAHDREAVAVVAERTLANTLEQMPLFLTLLWLHTVYVDAAAAGVLGLVFVGGRTLYPLCYAWYGHFTVLCSFATSPCYVVINHLAAGLAVPLVWPQAALRRMLPSNALLLAAAYFSGHMVAATLLWAYPIGSLAAKINLRANRRPARPAEKPAELH